jgi:PAS domain S-box-containing protein
MSDIARALDLGSARDIEGGLGDPFTAAFRATGMAMLITDPCQPDNPVIFVNDAFSDLTGYAREEALGRNCRFLQGAETDPEDAARLHAAIERGESAEIEILNYRKDGAPFWNGLYVSPVRDEAGRLLYFFASLVDVSEKRQAQEELRRAKDQLEAEVERRTRDLKAALDQKTVLLHEVDHRVKNNLQIVSSLVLLKARRVQDKAAQRALNNMAERISALATVHRLLYPAGDVSRFDMSEFIRDLSSDLVSTAEPDQIKLELDVEPIGVSSAKAAPLALMINELVTNAVRHAFPDGRKGRLAIAAARGDGELRIVVEDDGVGLNGKAPSDESFGTTLAEMLARQVRATLTFENAHPGTRAVVVVPLNAEEVADTRLGQETRP